MAGTRTRVRRTRSLRIAVTAAPRDAGTRGSADGAAAGARIAPRSPAETANESASIHSTAGAPTTAIRSPAMGAPSR
jgi:hypothetical protein